MGDYTRQVKKILNAHGCKFIRQGKGDHERWYSPITNKHFTIDGKIVKRNSANEQLKEAGITQKV
ncbi:MAG: type II toxin-antitoxin system HicA family toxin [Defluviitaleaceae bacterium]|nr:type II toxin-antitoxin system HicA family toxin [Defluviitaleaceae bacterium]